MLSQNQLKWIRSLHQKKFREQEGCFLAEGYKVVEEALQTGMTVRMIVGTPEFIHNMKSHPASTPAIEFIEANAATLERISSLTTPPDGLAVLARKQGPGELELQGDRCYLVLDGVRDPGNLGTILRIADWFGIASLIVSEDTVEEYNPKVVQSAMGSLFRVPILRVTVAEFIDRYRRETGQAVLAATMDGADVYRHALPVGNCLVLGNESEGIRAEALSRCTGRVSIPGFFEQGQGPESLNVAVSAAILLSEYRRVHPRP